MEKFSPPRRQTFNARGVFAARRFLDGFFAELLRLRPDARAQIVELRRQCEAAIGAEISQVFAEIENLKAELPEIARRLQAVEAIVAERGAGMNRELETARAELRAMEAALGRISSRLAADGVQFARRDESSVAAHSGDAISSAENARRALGERND